MVSHFRFATRVNDVGRAMVSDLWVCLYARFCTVTAAMTATVSGILPSLPSLCGWLPVRKWCLLCVCAGFGCCLLLLLSMVPVIVLMAYNCTVLFSRVQFDYDQILEHVFCERKMVNVTDKLSAQGQSTEYVGRRILGIRQMFSMFDAISGNAFTRLLQVTL